jgi:DNA (cytosine-5)-methyltransferase 1
MIAQPSGSDVTVTDLFCGAGGSSQGARKGGALVKMAVNHWRLAVETHQTNFPMTDHDCADVSQCDPRRYPRTNILIASPECTNHTSSKGVSRSKQNPSLFGDAPDPSAERSRATMWDVPRFVEARAWVMWDAWLHAMRLLGYDHRCVYFNSMFAYPTPQSRDRMYVVFWKSGNTAPQLDITPRAYCPRCAGDVNAVQSWKPGRTSGRYRKQYVYCCPRCALVIEPYYFAAANAIDWSLPTPRIGDRRRPLREKTLARIQAGLERFVQGRYQPSAAALFDAETPVWVRSALACAPIPPFTYSEGGWDNMYRRVDETLPAQTSSRSHCLTLPFVMQAAHSGEDASRFRLSDAALPTQHTGNAMGVVTIPLICETGHGGAEHAGRLKPADAPTSAQHTLGGSALVTAPFMAYLRTHSTPHAVSEPVQTVVAGATHHVLVHPSPSFTVAYNGADEGAHALDDALGAQPTHDRHALVTPGAPVTLPALDDCGFRVLAPHEVQRAMAFERDYMVLGTNRDKVKQLGNAVTPPVMELLIERCLATMRGEK